VLLPGGVFQEQVQDSMTQGMFAGLRERLATHPQGSGA